MFVEAAPVFYAKSGLIDRLPQQLARTRRFGAADTGSSRGRSLLCCVFAPGCAEDQNPLDRRYSAPVLKRLILFGASGDLTGRFLLPALAALHANGRLPDGFQIRGAATRDWDEEAFRRFAAERLNEHALTSRAPRETCSSACCATGLSTWATPKASRRS